MSKRGIRILDLNYCTTKSYNGGKVKHSKWSLWNTDDTDNMGTGFCIVLDIALPILKLISLNMTDGQYKLK